MANDFARELEHIYKTSNVGKLVGMKLAGTSYGALSSAVKQFCLFLYPMAVMGDNLGAAMAQVGIPEVVGTGFQTSGDVFHNWLNRNDGVQRDSLARLTPEQRERYAIASGGFDMDLIRNMTDSLLKGPERELRGHPTVGEKIAETTGVVYDYLGSKAAWQMAQELGSQVWLKKVDELTKQFKGRFSQDVIDKMAADMSMSMMMMKQSWIMSKEASAIGAVALLATAYTVTGLRLLTGAIPALEIAMPFRSLKHQALNGEIRSAMAKHYAGHLATGLLGSYIFIFMMNMLLAGRPPWENEEGKRMKIAYNKDKNGKEMYLDFPFTRQFSSYVEMLPELIGNKIGLPYETSTMRWWTNKIAPIPRVMLGLMFGTDISGQKVRDPGATDWENLTNQAQWAIRNMAPRVGGPGGARGEWLTPEELWMPFVTGAMVSTSRTSDERQSTLGRQREEYLRTQSLRILGGYQPEDPRRQSKMQELMQQGSLSRSAARNMDRSRDRQTMRSLKRYNRNPNIVEFFKGKGHEE